MLAAVVDFVTYICGEGVTIDGADKGVGFLISMDAPEHTWIRKLLSLIFTPRRLAELEPFVRRVAVQYLDATREKDRFDIVQDFSLRLPLAVAWSPGSARRSTTSRSGPAHVTPIR